MQNRLRLGRKGAALTVIAMLLAAVVTLAVACGGSSGSNSSGLSGTISESGSTTVQPLANDLANAFMKENPHVLVIIRGGGSSAGIKDANAGTSDIGASSRALTSSDPALITYLLGYDGIAVITNNGNSVSGLTKQQVAYIFSGNITNWKQVGGTDAKIIVVIREEGSGTRSSFEGVVMNGSQITADHIETNSNGIMKTTVSGAPNSIGYLSLGYLDNTVKTLTFNGVACTEATVKNGTYPISHPLYFLTKTQATGTVKAFIDYCTGTAGQAIVTQDGYVPAQ